MDPNRSAKKFLGDTSFFCPVALKEKGVLWPGDPEFGAKFREKIYYLTDADARERFLADPASYLSKDKPSAVRLYDFTCLILLKLNMNAVLYKTVKCLLCH